MARGVVCELLKALREDIIIPLTQREDKASYYSHPSDLELDFGKSAEENNLQGMTLDEINAEISAVRSGK